MQLLKLVLLVIGTVLVFLYIILTLRGREYDAILTTLPKKGFSDKDLLAPGYALQKIPMFGINSKLGKKLMTQAAILHPENGGKYAEFWARLYLARTLGLSMMVITFSFCIAPLMDEFLMILVAIFGVASVWAIYSQGANEMENILKKRADACLMEFSNVVSKLALLMNCGLIMKDAWFQVANSKEGEIYDLMREACAEMNSGRSAAEAVYNFGIYTTSPEIRKFSSIIIQNIEKGGSDVTMYMRQQSEELWAHRRQLMLKKGDEAAAKLLIPTMLILAGVLVIIMSGAVSNMSI